MRAVLCLLLTARLCAEPLQEALLLDECSDCALNALQLRGRLQAGKEKDDEEHEDGDNEEKELMAGILEEKAGDDWTPTYNDPKCMAYTGDHCNFGGCHDDQGECRWWHWNFKCMCPAGSCAAPDHRCYKNSENEHLGTFVIQSAFDVAKELTFSSHFTGLFAMNRAGKNSEGMIKLHRVPPTWGAMSAGKLLISSERFPDHVATSGTSCETVEDEDLLQEEVYINSSAFEHRSNAALGSSLDPRRRYSSVTSDSRRRYSASSSATVDSRRRYSASSSATVDSRRRYSASSSATVDSRRRYSAGSSETLDSRRRYSASSSATVDSRRRYSAGSSATVDSRRRYSASSSATVDPRRRYFASSSTSDSRRRDISDSRRRRDFGPDVVVVNADDRRRRTHQECHPIVSSTWVKNPSIEMLFEINRVPPRLVPQLTVPHMQGSGGQFFTIRSVGNGCFISVDSGDTVACALEPEAGSLWRIRFAS